MNDTFAPYWYLKVDGEVVGDEITRYIQGIEYESVDGMADLGRLRCVNPDSFLSDVKVFQPGNDLSFFIGYGLGNAKFIGTVSIVRCVPNYPQEGIPTLQVVGYSKDHEMMDTEPSTGKKRMEYGRNYANAVSKVADRHKMEKDIDSTTNSHRMLIQKAGMKDYEFVKGISNITGYLLWVDADEKGKWWLHFKNPKSLKPQKKIYTFEYDFGDEGSLLSFTPELLVKGAKTNLVVVAKDAHSGKILKAEYSESDNRVKTPDMDARGVFSENLKTEYPNASAIKLYFNNYSFEYVTTKKFNTQAEVVDWAQQWFERMKENFILSRGRIIGNETLMARQVHRIYNVGTAYDGEYYFSKVKHVFTDNQGYVCDIGARKVAK